jgi:hypothetical protein
MRRFYLGIGGFNGTLTSWHQCCDTIYVLGNSDDKIKDYENRRIDFVG